MSTLKVNTISNTGGTASTSSDNVINGCAKAWVNFNGTGTVAIRASYNVTSITDNAVGDYSVNMTNALADANYVVTAATSMAQAAANYNGAVCLDTVNATAAASPPTTSSFRVGTRNSAVNAIDIEYIKLAVFR